MQKQFSWKVVYVWMDKITKTKREHTIYLWQENNSSCSEKKTTVRAVGREKVRAVYQ